MNLLGAVLYDPAAAVSKATSALLAMTALDTTNLRLTVTVPAHGMVRFRMRCVITGATTAPTIFLGVMNGATVVGRVAPAYENATANAATQNFLCDAEFTATGLTPGSINFDAAYAVQVVVAATNIKYGGPNTNAGANAWGAFTFEAWDPRPMTLALDGGINVKQWNGTNVATPATAGIPDVNVKNMNNVAATPITTIKAVQGLATDGVVPTVTTLTNLPAITSNWLTAAGIATSALNGKGDWNIGKTGYALSAAGVQAIWDALTSALTTVGSIGKKLVDSVTQTGDAYARLGAPAGASVSADIAAVKTDTGTTIPGRLPAALVSGRMDSSVGAMAANVVTASAINASALNGKGDWNIGKTGYALSAAGVQAIWDALTSALTTASSIGKLLVDNINATISSRSTYAGGDTPGTTTLLSRLTSGRATNLDNLDATVSGRASQTSVDAVKTVTDKVNTAVELDGAVYRFTTNALEQSPAGGGGGLDAAGVRAAIGLASANLDTQLGDLPTNAELTTAIAPVKTKTDSLSFTIANKVDANVTHVNETEVGGTGTGGDPWGPA